MKKNDGETVVFIVKAKNPLVKTAIGGKSYTLGSLVRLAQTGSLTADELSQNEALKGISQTTAREMVEQAIRLKSVHLEVSEAPKKAKETEKETPQ